MYPVSSDFLNAVRESSARVTVIDIYAIETSTPLLADVVVKDGVVRIDRNADHHRTATVTVASQELITQFKTGVLDPRLIEIWIRSGIDYGIAKGKELVPLGVFRVSKLSWSEAEQILTLELVDRSILLKKYSHQAVSDYGGRKITDVITSTIQALGNMDVVFEGGTEAFPTRLPGSATYDGTTLEMFKKLLEILGAEGAFDGNGIYRVKRIVFIDGGSDPADAVFEIDAGETGVLIDASRGVNLDNVYNFIAVYGATDAAGKPVYGSALDSDPASPTYYYGVFGKAIKVIQNNNLISVSQCTIAANAALRDSIGLAESLSITCLPNSALYAGDTVIVTYPDESSELHLLDSIQLPLAGGQMQITTKTGVHPEF